MIYKLDPQLDMISSLLIQLDIKYCIDSGTLLGIIREGALLANDLDIDISIHDTQLSKVHMLKSELRIRGYKSRILSFHGQIYKIKFSNSQEKRFIDINIFSKSMDNIYYVCPQPSPILNNENFLFFYTRKIIRIIFGIIKNIGSEFDLNYFPWKLGTIHDTWVIPNDYFDNFQHLIDNIYVPNNYESYLKFRYGEWKTPKKNWNFRTDDMALAQYPPTKYRLYKL
ncbi:hypothetical protein N9V39_00895 [Gammaproteobacteria bacterium]|nr:hypothetical protein [Gammaproteobacteria bacterium]